MNPISTLFLFLFLGLQAPELRGPVFENPAWSLVRLACRDVEESPTRGSDHVNLMGTSGAIKLDLLDSIESCFDRELYGSS
jgi:hypothetical protein